MGKSVLIIVNGLPGSGKTTLAGRLGADARLPVFSRDGIYETLVDALAGDEVRQPNGELGSAKPLQEPSFYVPRSPFPASVGAAAYRLMYYAAGAVLAAGAAAIIEGFFGRPDLRTAELEELRRRSDFEPLQIVCKADGTVLLERFLARAGAVERHEGHADMAWLEANRERLLRGALAPLALGGRLIEFDTTTPDDAAYGALLGAVLAVI